MGNSLWASRKPLDIALAAFLQLERLARVCERCQASAKSGGQDEKENRNSDNACQSQTGTAVSISIALNSIPAAAVAFRAQTGNADSDGRASAFKRLAILSLIRLSPRTE